MSKEFAETATESELRDFAAKVFKQCKTIRTAESKFEAANTAEKESKGKLKRLGDEKNTLIEEMDEEPKSDQAKAIKDKRFEELRAEIEASEKNTIKNEAKHTFAKEQKTLQEMIDESNEDQQRIDFDKANRSKTLIEMPAGKTGIEQLDEDGVAKEWRNNPIDGLNIPPGMMTPLKEMGITDLGLLQSLCFGDIEGYENGPSSIPNWGAGKVQKLTSAITEYMETNGIEDFDLSLEDPPVPLRLEDQFAVLSSVSNDDDEEYQDVIDE